MLDYARETVADAARRPAPPAGALVVGAGPAALARLQPGGRRGNPAQPRRRRRSRDGRGGGRDRPPHGPRPDRRRAGEGTRRHPRRDPGEDEEQRPPRTAALLEPGPRGRRSRRRQGRRKLAKAIELVKELLDDGYRPIVFCRFIPTAEYVADDLRERLPQERRSGRPSPARCRPRSARSACRSSAESPRARAGCTDCLSEGINLQEHFDAVVHYDLSWNPTRHEQREGRVDRYGQPKNDVRVLTYYGMDNQIDGIVLDVLLRKHKTHPQLAWASRCRCRSTPSEVVEAIFEGLLLREQTGERRSDYAARTSRSTSSPGQRRLDAEWEAAAEREKRSRTMFAQETHQGRRGARELDAARDAIGSGADVRRLHTATRCRPTAPSSRGRHRAASTSTSAADAPRALRGSLTAATTKLHARFELPVPDGSTTSAARTRWSKASPPTCWTRRSTRAQDGDRRGRPALRRHPHRAVVQRARPLLLLRFRYHLITKRAGAERLEHCSPRMPCSPPSRAHPTNARWLDDEARGAARRHARARTSPPEQAADFVQTGHRRPRTPARGATWRRRHRALRRAAPTRTARACGRPSSAACDLPGAPAGAARRARHLRVPADAAGRGEARMTRTRDPFTTVRTEGALLPPDLLQRVMPTGDKASRPASGGLPPRPASASTSRQPLAGSACRAAGSLSRTRALSCRAATPAPRHPRALAAAALPGARLRPPADRQGGRARRPELPRLPRLAARADPPGRLQRRPRPTHGRRRRRRPHQPAQPGAGVSSTAPTTTSGASSPTVCACACCATTSASPARPTSSSTSRR